MRPALVKNLVTQMLTGDLFTVANLLACNISCLRALAYATVDKLHAVFKTFNRRPVNKLVI